MALCSVAGGRFYQLLAGNPIEELKGRGINTVAFFMRGRQGADLRRNI